MSGNTIFSGEPLPNAPAVDNAELAAFHRKLVEYLRRLGEKLNRYVDPGKGMETYAGYISGDSNQTLGTDYEDLEWTADLHKDAQYVHSTASNQAQLQVLEAGLYLILCDIELESGPVFPVVSRIVLVSPSGRVKFSYGSIGAAGTISMSVAVPLKALTTVKIQARDEGGGGGDYIKTRGTRLTVVRLSPDDKGGSSGTPGTGWDTTTPSWLPGLVES